VLRSAVQCCAVQCSAVLASKLASDSTAPFSSPGLPDFSWHNIPKRGKIYQITTKLPNFLQIAQMSITYSKWSYNIQSFSILRPSKIYPNWYFWFENLSSGKPVLDWLLEAETANPVLKGSRLHKPNYPWQVSPTTRIETTRSAYIHSLTFPLLHLVPWHGSVVYWYRLRSIWVVRSNPARVHI
jgi:hypothetical protein